MSLQRIVQRPYTFLPSGILIVEPHEGLLAARSMFLAAADYYVGISGLPHPEVEQGKDAEVAVAILSESLGRTVLSLTAMAIRRNWPRARILIFGRRDPAIDDNLYDVRIDDQARPEGLLAALLALSADPWNPRAAGAAQLADCDGARLQRTPGLVPLSESDPTKRLLSALKQPLLSELPGAGHRFRQAV